jgi:hypothetical protein
MHIKRKATEHFRKYGFIDSKNGKRRRSPSPKAPGEENHDLVFTLNNPLLKFYENHFIIVAKNYP